MTNKVLAARERKRLDAIVAQPLARFRRTLIALTADELTALEKRIAVHMARNQWARGGHGLERHRAISELGLLSRRRAATRHESDLREASEATQLRLVEPETNFVLTPLPEAGVKAA
jgi:hypothetical protein